MIAELFDKLAGKWLDWRTEQTIKNSPDLTQFKKIDVDIKENQIEVVAFAPNIWILAEQAARLLEANNAKNYIEVDMMPRLDRGIRPVRVTVQWANGESPAVKAARLESENVALRQLVENAAAQGAGGK